MAKKGQPSTPISIIVDLTILLLKTGIYYLIYKNYETVFTVYNNLLNLTNKMRII